jgi:integrase
MTLQTSEATTSEPASASKRATNRRGRGEGYIEQLPSGKWRAVLSLGRDPTTKKRRKLTHTADTKKEALAWLRARQDEQNKGVLATPGKLTLGDWLDTWLAMNKPSVAPRTYEQYEEHVRLHLKPKLGATLLSHLDAEGISRFFAALTLSSAMMAKVATTLRAALKAAVPKYLITNPATQIPKPKSEAPEIVVWTTDEVRRFLRAIRGHRLEALYVLALDSGCRQGELFGLQWPDLRGNMLSIRRSLEEDKQSKLRTKPPKTKASRRSIPLSNATIVVLAAHREAMKEEGWDVETGTIFVDTDGGWLRRSNLRFSQILKRAKLPRIRFHDLRHTSATQLLLNGANIKAVSRRLGHTKIKITLETYAHLLPEMDDKIVAVMEELLKVENKLSSSDSPTVVPQKAEKKAKNKTKKAS